MTVCAKRTEIHITWRFVIIYTLWLVLSTSEWLGHRGDVFRMTSFLCTLPIALLALAGALLRRVRGPLLCLDAAGVTVQGHPRVEWAAFKAVRWSKGRTQMVIFEPQPDVSLPVIPPPWLFYRPHARASAQARRHGSPLIVLLSNFPQGTEIRIRNAVNEYSDVPFLVEVGEPRKV
jgi:hypothetical protein